MAGSFDTFVVDSSYVLASLLPDESSPESDEIIRGYLDEKINLISSPIFNLEVLNGLIAAKLTRRIDSDECNKIAIRFLKLEIVCEDVDYYKTFLLSQESGLTIYDSSYVFLARSKNIPLLSLDSRMKNITNKDS